MWSMDYVQVPVEKTEVAVEAVEAAIEETKEEIKQKKKAELVKQMSLSTDGSGNIKELINLNTYLMQISSNRSRQIRFRKQHFRSL